MNNYTRTGTINQNEANPQEAQESQKDPKAVKVNGYQQILDMLTVADPEFRESLLRRLTLKDRNLAENLRRELEF